MQRSLAMHARRPAARGVAAAHRRIWGMSAQPEPSDSLVLPMDIACPAPLFTGAWSEYCCCSHLSAAVPTVSTTV